MKKFTLDEIKFIELQLLLKIHDICREQGFRYTLIGGSLLGAVRHKGFIPWDDDIDIAMPRPDYEKFMEHCKNNCNDIIALCNKYEPNYGYLFGKICAADTVLVEENANRFNVDMGIYVDVFPIDALGDTYKEAVSKFRQTELFRELLVAANWKRFFKSKTHSVIYEPIRYIMYIVSRLFSFRFLISKIECKSVGDYDNAKYVGVICGSYRKKEIMKKEIFESPIEMDFESHKVCGIKNYDSYLKNIYGNYMEMPPAEKRITHHTFEAWKKD